MKLLQRLRLAARAARLAFVYSDVYGINDMLCRKTISGAPLTDDERKLLVERVRSSLTSHDHYRYRNAHDAFMAQSAEYKSLEIDSGEAVPFQRRCKYCREAY